MNYHHPLQPTSSYVSCSSTPYSASYQQTGTSAYQQSTPTYQANTSTPYYQGSLYQSSATSSYETGKAKPNYRGGAQHNESYNTNYNSHPQDLPQYDGSQPYSQQSQLYYYGSMNTLKRKRMRPQYSEGPGGKKMKKSKGGAIIPKNPVSLLNELRVGLDYTIDNEMQGGDNRFFASVTVDGNTFRGESTSKKDAKQVCAEIALKHFINSPSSKLYSQLAAKVAEYPGQIVPADKLCELFYSAKDKKTPANSYDSSKTSATAQPCDNDVKPITNGSKLEMIKLPLVLSGGGTNKKKKKKDSHNILEGWKPPLDSNPTMILNQVHGPQDWECVFESTGPIKEFTMKIVIGNQVFEATAPNKKTAKAAAARQALKKLFNIELNAGGEGKVEVKDMSSTKSQEEGKAEGIKFPVDLGPRGSSEKNPTQLLNELMGASVHFEQLGESGPAHARVFTVKVECKGQPFEGQGHSKKLAKAAAAKEALAGVFNITNIAAFSKMPGRSVKVFPIPQHLMAPQPLADHIGKLINQKFAEMVEGEETYSRRKVLAGIVMTTGEALEDASIVCVSTGTKCISGEHMSTEGKSLNDCHAEIISRRCLVHFLLTKLEDSVQRQFPQDCIFEKTGNRFRVKPNVNFHLFINTSPCGDARIFSPHEASSEEDSADRHPNRKARGQLRTKIESGEGTIPVKSNAGVQTWDGVMEGQRLLTMSCSDKIAKWNVVGIQGSLLSIFIEPVYLQTIILGSLFHPQHMFRAMCGRIENTLEPLPQPFHLQKPSMNMISSPESRQPGKSPNYSLSWITGFQDTEVMNAVTGKDEVGNPSKICKHALFTKWMALAKKLSAVTGYMLPKNSVSYGDIKSSAREYQVAKEAMYTAFQKSDLGTWIKKPMEQDQFTLDNRI